jgi:hypothetical protein
MVRSITGNRAPAGSAVKAASRRLRRWPSASFDRLRPAGADAAVIERGKSSAAPTTSQLTAACAARCRAERDGW